MAEKLERKVMEVYGENAATRDIIAYGSDIAGNIVETKDPDVIQTEAYKTGVRSAVVGNNSTTLQNRQALDFLFSRQLKYLYQHGIAEWGATETYFVNSFAVGSDGNIYVSLTDNNKGKDPTTDTTNWQAFPTPAEIAKKVNKAGDTMTGNLLMSGVNQVRFGTADNFYYVRLGDNFDIGKNDINNLFQGLMLNTSDNLAPYYVVSGTDYRLLTTKDLPGSAGSVGFPNYGAGIRFNNNINFTAPSDGFIFWWGQSEQGPNYALINNIEVGVVSAYGSGDVVGCTQTFIVKKGDIFSGPSEATTSLFCPFI